ncbi:MAG TPA: D-glycero-beta-D-manno-heptose 1-phosphate adenylyltransferase [Sulfurihydrogenibium sp.]|jgi:rfaE bifunctional protein nucleotidyltransferase chain/domain|uniref:D-glycero-beta-D-manno-heptose 1-phosphate adenylyltransferase n=1 Tax=Sulfurihydrogenibium yellowstonense SS-5 TaxID=432331 RepID=C4FHK7_9AQUI|nr:MULTISPECIES: D-glycero-beta-D-manno-heptose 1-phosphate adenylyltransferase [Sulfurihydrogenibium]ACD66234.1 rfaE bifunctional protein [Sulfurihydrogenibium sp. YO3AOP1]EEP61441.1 bifunctional protein RfaE, domain II [Sulfurihydrogenibium yellowstonense SS-5]HBT99380.1 D-glycero-beta-D-manno-heptose 1-phosphate adenylyltransferase [Sulfurihydrogenibium sp.]
MDYLDIIQKEREKGKKIVFTNGCFDIIHAGHVDYLEKAKSLGDFLVVGLNSDESVKRLKGPTRPVNPVEQRKKVLQALKPVDLVIVFEEDTPERLIKEIKPDVLVKGGDWKIENIVGADFVMSYGGKVYTIDFVYDTSTTKIIEKVKNESA